MADVDAELADLDLPADPPSEGSPPAGPQADDPRSSGGLLFSLLTIAVFALPILCATALLGIFVLEVATAEALEHTGGFQRRAFGAAWRLVWKLHLGLLAWCLIRRIASHDDPNRRPWKPLTWLWAGYLIAIWITVPLDVYGVVDVPDRLTTLLLVGAHALAGMMLPLLVLLLLARMLSFLWQRGRASVASYRRIVGLATAMELGLVTVVAGAVLYSSGPKTTYTHGTPPLATRTGDLSSGFDFDLDDLEDVEQWTYDRYVKASGELGAEVELPPIFTAQAEPEDLFAECARQLASPRGGGQAEIAKAIDTIERSWQFDRADAEDLAMDALIKTCHSYAGRPRDWIVQTYWTAVRNESINRKKRRSTRRRYAGDVDDLLRDWQETPDPLDILLDKQKVDAARLAYWGLPARDRRIVDLRLDGHSYAEIERITGVDAPTARKRYQRALDKMRRSARTTRWNSQ